MIDLIGRPYRRGADGTGEDGAIDCINLVYEVEKRLGVPTPPFNPSWYEQCASQFGKDLLKWGDRVDRPEYDGDVLLLDGTGPIFAVVWNNGCLYINETLKAVTWCPLEGLSSNRCFRMKRTLSKL